jgi:ATP-binding cassette subfamily B protein
MEKEKENNPISLLRRFARPYKGKFAASVFLAVLGVASGLVPYLAVARMVVGLLAGEGGISFYLFWCAVAAAGYLGKALLANWSTTISHTATFMTLRDIRKSLVSKFSRMPMGALLDTPSGRYKDVIVDRVEGLEPTLAHMLPEMTASILGPILLFVFLFVLDWRMALVSLITLPVGMIFMVHVMKTYPAQYAGSVEVGKRMNSAVVEYIGGIEVIKGFNQSARSYQKYADAVNDNAAYFYNWMKSCQLPHAAFFAICPATLTTVLPIGFFFYANGSLPAPEFITVIILSLGIIGPILTAINFTDSIAAMGTVVQQVDDILSAPELGRPTKDAKISDPTIALKNVSFSYHENSAEPALCGVDLTIRPGTVTALVGPSGSGKSTIARLIAGFWDVTEGEIMIGDVNLMEIPQRQLSSLISYVAQDNYLFDDTVRENIRMGRRSASDAEVEAAAKNAGCDAFIRGLEHGYDTRVGGAGSHLSGGERQRVAIARAMLKDAPIVILDEATAYTDPENEAEIQRSVSRLVAGKTLLVIAHRLSTVTDSDQIVLVNKGRVEANGKHEELLAASELYRTMWQAHIGVRDGA